MACASLKVPNSTMSGARGLQSRDPVPNVGLVGEAGLSEEEKMGIFVARRRLSVVSDNHLIEGYKEPGSSASLERSGGANAHGGGVGRVSVGMGQAPGSNAGCWAGGTAGGGGSGAGYGVVGGCYDDEEEEEDEAIPCIVSSYAGYSKKGYAPYNPRKRNQDALVMAEDASTASVFLAVMDGHGEVGDKVAQAFKRGLAPAVFDHPDWEQSPEVAVAESVHKIERALLGDPTVDTDFSGTTLLSVCIRGTQLIVTNVGDSRITLGRRRVGGAGEAVTVGRGFKSTLVAQPLTEDHKPDTPTEKQRILCAGGRVFSVEYADGVDGPPRVWLGNVDMPGLAMSRSLGDAVAHTAGVTSEPDTYRCDLFEGTDRRAAAAAAGYGSAAFQGLEGEAVVLILATDGLWEFVSDQEAVDIASQCTEPREAVERLIQEAGERWLKEEQVIDDTTVCVAFLKSRMPGG